MALTRTGPRWWVWVPALAAAAAFVTVSRAAQSCHPHRLRRRPVLPPAVVSTADDRRLAAAGGLSLFVFREQVLDLLGAYAGESDDRARTGQDLRRGVRLHRHPSPRPAACGLRRGDRAGRAGSGTGRCCKDDADKTRTWTRGSGRSTTTTSLHYLRYGYPRYDRVPRILRLGRRGTSAREALARDGPLSDLAAGLFGAFVAVAIMARGVAFSFRLRRPRGCSSPGCAWRAGDRAASVPHASAPRGRRGLDHSAAPGPLPDPARLT